MFLTADELTELTRRRRGDAQARALRFMGIEHKKRPDGSIAVLRAHVDALLGGKNMHSIIKTAEPNWSAI